MEFSKQSIMASLLMKFSTIRMLIPLVPLLWRLLIQTFSGLAQVKVILETVLVTEGASTVQLMEELLGRKRGLKKQKESNELLLILVILMWPLYVLWVVNGAQIRNAVFS